MIDITSDFAFSEGINVMKNSDLSFILEALDNYAWRMGTYKEAPALAKLQLEALSGITMNSAQSRLWINWGKQYASRIFHKARTSNKSRFSLFFDSSVSQKEFSLCEAELSAEAFFLLFAGMTCRYVYSAHIQ